MTMCAEDILYRSEHYYYRFIKLLIYAQMIPLVHFAKTQKGLQIPATN